MLFLGAGIALLLKLCLDDDTRKEEALALGRKVYIIPELLLILIGYDGIWSRRSSLFGTRWRRLDQAFSSFDDGYGIVSSMALNLRYHIVYWVMNLLTGPHVFLKPRNFGDYVTCDSQLPKIDLQN